VGNPVKIPDPDGPEGGPIVAAQTQVTLQLICQSVPFSVRIFIRSALSKGREIFFTEARTCSRSPDFVKPFKHTPKPALHGLEGIQAQGSGCMPLKAVCMKPPLGTAEWRWQVRVVLYRNIP